MLSEGSSGRVDSGNAFEGNSPSHSNQGDRHTPKFSWMDSSQRDSASRQEEVAEGSSRSEGEQGDNEASSLDQVEWSYAHSTSTLTGPDAHRLVDQYGMVIIIPQELDRAHKPPRGHVMASETFLKFEVRFPLHRSFRDILCFYRLTVF